MANLKKKASENVSVSKKSGKDLEVIKVGTPLDHSRKHNIPNVNDSVVGVNIGVTLNMEDYNSLRADCWLTDSVGDNETQEEAFNRVLGVVDKTLKEVISYYKE